MEILGRRYAKVQFTENEIIKKFTTPTCVPWMEFRFNDGLIEVGCECNHCNGLKVRLINYIKA